MATLRSTREIVVWAEVKDILDRKRAHLIETEMPAAVDMRAVGKAQGRLEMLNEVANLPNVMQAEADAQRADAADRLLVAQSQDSRTWQNEHVQAVMARERM